MGILDINRLKPGEYTDEGECLSSDTDQRAEDDIPGSDSPEERPQLSTGLPRRYYPVP